MLPEVWVGRAAIMILGRPVRCAMSTAITQTRLNVPRGIRLRRQSSSIVACLFAIACTKQPSDRPVVTTSPSGIQSTSALEHADSTSDHPQPPAKLEQIAVFAGERDRHHSIVTFPLTPNVAGALILRDGRGKVVPLQRHTDGTAKFILDSLEAGQSAVYTIERAEASTPSGPTVMARGKSLELGSNARRVARFQMEGELPPGIDEVYLRGGYLHPVYTPGGIVVTGDYPDSHNHQHGIWSAWTRARFNDRTIDFWNMADRQGKVDFQSLEQTWQGPVFAGFTARLAHIDLLGDQPVVALDERWTITTYQTHQQAPPYFLIDLESSQRTATKAPLLLQEYTYGGFALRGHPQWDEPADVTFLTSEGLDRARGDNTKGRWCAIEGEVNGVRVGFAMLGHPQNFRAPQTFRIHPKHPYMAFAPVKDGPFAIEPGKPYRTRFRIVTFDGPVDRELIDRLWHDYASPAEVSVEQTAGPSSSPPRPPIPPQPTEKGAEQTAPP